MRISQPLPLIACALIITACESRVTYKDADSNSSLEHTLEQLEARGSREIIEEEGDLVCKVDVTTGGWDPKPEIPFIPARRISAPEPEVRLKLGWKRVRAESYMGHVFIPDVKVKPGMKFEVDLYDLDLVFHDKIDEFKTELGTHWPFTVTEANATLTCNLLDEASANQLQAQMLASFKPLIKAVDESFNPALDHTHFEHYSSQRNAATRHLEELEAIADDETKKKAQEMWHASKKRWLARAIEITSDVHAKLPPRGTPTAAGDLEYVIKHSTCGEKLALTHISPKLSSHPSRPRGYMCIVELEVTNKSNAPLTITSTLSLHSFQPVMEMESDVVTIEAYTRDGITSDVSALGWKRGKKAPASIESIEDPRRRVRDTLDAGEHATLYLSMQRSDRDGVLYTKNAPAIILEARHGFDPVLMRISDTP